MNQNGHNSLNGYRKMMLILERDHSSITSAKRWVGGVRKRQFLLIYSTIYADVSAWVGGPKKAKNMLT